MERAKPWLMGSSWAHVQAVNQEFCEQQGITYDVAKTCEAARLLWEQSTSRAMELIEALDLCRKCYEIAPFVFHNGNTFAAIAREVVVEWSRTMPSVEAQILRNTVGHYVVGMISRRELQKVLRHFESSWDSFVTAYEVMSRRPNSTTAVPMTVPEARPQVEQTASSAK